MFKALVLNQEDRNTIAAVTEIDESQLPEGNVKIDVNYSSLSYNGK